MLAEENYFPVEWQSRWKLYQPLPRMKLELQINYRTIILNNQVKTSWKKVLYPRIYRRSHNEAG